MGTYDDSLHALLVALLNNPMKSIRRTVVKILNRLSFCRGDDGRLVVDVVTGKQSVQKPGLSWRRMVKSRHAIPFADAILSIDLGLGFIGMQGRKLVQSRVQSLNAPIERRGDKFFNGGIQRDKFVREFFGLERSVPSKSWIRWNSGRGRDIRLVGAGLSVNNPIRSKLAQAHMSESDLSFRVVVVTYSMSSNIDHLQRHDEYVLCSCSIILQNLQIDKAGGERHYRGSDE